MSDPLPVSRNTLLSALLIALAVLTYWPSAAALWAFWSDDNTAGEHGFIVAPLAMWLLYRARHRLGAVEVRPSPVAAVLLFACSIAWLVFWRAGIQELHLLLLPVLMGLAVTTALGWQAALVVAFPIGYLYFAVPAWGIFIEPLQMLTVHVIGVLAPMIGVPAHLAGSLVIMPNGIIEIAHGCSGQAFLTVGLAVGALLGEVENASLKRRAVLLAVFGAAAVVANWLRVLVIVDAGYTTNMRHVLVSRGHFLFGWILFSTILVLAVWFLARHPNPAPLPQGGRSVGARPAWLVAALALIAVPLAIYVFVLRLDARATAVAFNAPEGQGRWRGPMSSAAAAWHPDYVGAHSQWYFAYEGPAGHNVDMVAIGYPLQEQGRELVNEENQLFGSGAAAPTAETRITFNGDTYIEFVSADEQGRTLLTWSVYDIGGEEFVTPLWSQLWYGVRSLAGPPYSVQFAFRTMCDNSCDAARATLGDFLKTMRSGFFASVGRVPPATTAMSRPL